MILYHVYSTRLNRKRCITMVWVINYCPEQNQSVLLDRRYAGEEGTFEF